MKIFKLTTLLMMIGTLGFTSCTSDDEPEYLGEIITEEEETEETTGITYMTFTGAGEGEDRFYAFSGTADTDLSSIPSGDWTYELWINVDPLASIGNADEPSGQTAEGASISERDGLFELYLIADADEDADYAVKFNRLDADNLPTGTMESSTVTNLKFDEWVHVAISRSSTDGIAKFYINGVLIDSSDDILWEMPASDAWLDFNYMFRGGRNMNFFKGSYDNIRVSYVDRYPSAFTPDQSERFVVDDNTLIQMDLDNNLTPFDPVSTNDKVEIKGIYTYYIQVVNTVTWTTE